MAAPSEVFKCSCSSCGVHLEFPLELLDSSINCPSCDAETRLTLPLVEEDAPAVRPQGLSFATILGAFQGPVRGPRASFFYQIGLFLLTGAILILPLLYLLMVAAAGLSVYWWATHATVLFTGRTFGFYILLAKIFIYLTPLIAGTIVVFFMIKPLLARRPKHAQPLALNAANEPLLFAFITEICRTVGAPVPSRIDVDCNLNASASFRRALRSFFGNDLVLTLGLPLVAGTNITQLGGVIAHEFGHFTQSLAMRLNYIIRGVNSWFVRIIYERDEWDLMLEEWALDAEEWWMQMLVAVARLGIWFSRLLLKVLMWIGVAISAFVSRQMEYNADAYEIEFAGSQVFEETTVCFATLGASLNPAYKIMRISWNQNRSLPDNFPSFLTLLKARMPEEQRSAIADRAGLDQAPWYSTHPATGDRIRCARLMQKPGVFSLDAPARQLFSNFEVLSRQVSLLHYVDDLNLPQPLINPRAAESFFEQPASNDSEEANPAREAFEKSLGPVRLKLKSSGK
jgi:Zn-dependent protease with chaperone function